jgi:hypothetical protein
MFGVYFFERTSVKENPLVKANNQVQSILEQYKDKIEGTQDDIAKMWK